MYMYYYNKELNNIYITHFALDLGPNQPKNVHLGPGQRTLKFLLYKVHYEGA